MWGRLAGYCPTPGQPEAYNNFLDETAKLRQELAAKLHEYNALMPQSNPDPRRMEKLPEELTEIHDQLLAKAQASGLGGLNCGTWETSLFR